MIYVVSSVWLHALDSGRDVSTIGIYRTKEAAVAAGEAYRKGKNDQYDYSISEFPGELQCSK